MGVAVGFEVEGAVGEADVGEDRIDVFAVLEAGDGVFDGGFDGFVDGDVVLAGHGAEEDAAAVEVVDFGLIEGGVVEGGVGGDIGDGEGELAAEAHVIGHFGDGGDTAGFGVDDEEEDVGFVFGLHFGGFAGFGPFAEGELGVVVGDAGGFEGGDGDVAAPGGEAGGAAEEDLSAHSGVAE